MKNQDIFQKIVAHCSQYGFVFQSSEIYEGLSAVYDYGPMGNELKRNIKNLWWLSMTQLHQNIFGIDAAIFMHPTTWKASGHVDAFNDPLIDNKDSKVRYRADVLLEEYTEKLRKKGKKEQAENIEKRLAQYLETNNLQGVYDLIIECEIACPVSGTRNWTEVRQFNLMFKTEMGSVAGQGMDIYLRPETAQGIFVNFSNVVKTNRGKLPMGIAQIGKAFRNEIVARQFLFRMREFEQMEMQFFVAPDEEMQWYEYWKEKRLKWHKAIGISDSNLRYHDHIKLAHYAKAACDIEYQFSFGFKEVEGIHARGNFDLSQHIQYSGKKLEYFDNELKKSYVPHVVETSIGADRAFLMVLFEGYHEEQAPTADGKTELRVVLKVHPVLAPVKLAVFPLNNRDGLPEICDKIIDECKYDFKVVRDDKDTIGRRYRRQDLLGTPYCATIDYDTPNDQCVTIRDRDTMQQERIPLDKVRQYIMERTAPSAILKLL